MPSRAWRWAALTALASCQLLVDVGNRQAPSDAGADAGAVADAAIGAVADTATGGPPLEAGAPQSSLLAEWLFDDFESGAGKDTSGHNRHATFAGDAKLASTGVRGGALVTTYAGKGGMAATQLDNIAFPRTGTLAMWLRVDTAPGASDLIFDVFAAGRSHIFMRRTVDGQLQIAMHGKDPDPASPLLFVDDTPLFIGKWVHIALGWDTVKHQTVLFVDGVEEVRRGMDETFVPSEQYVRFGYAADAAFDEIRIYDRVLNVVEVSNLVGVGD